VSWINPDMIHFLGSSATLCAGKAIGGMAGHLYELPSGWNLAADVQAWTELLVLHLSACSSSHGLSSRNWDKGRMGKRGFFALQQS